MKADVGHGQFKVRWKGDTDDFDSTRAHLHLMEPEPLSDNDGAIVGGADANATAIPAAAAGQ